MDQREKELQKARRQGFERGCEHANLMVRRSGGSDIVSRSFVWATAAAEEYPITVTWPRVVTDGFHEYRVDDGGKVECRYRGFGYRPWAPFELKPINPAHYTARFFEAMADLHRNPTEEVPE